MRAILFIFIFWTFCVLAFSQTLAPTVLSSGGANSSNGGFMLSSTVGELIVTTETNGNQIITQGFQQSPKIIYNTIKEYNPEINVTAYPNPVSDFLYVNIKSKDSYRSCKIILIDVFGKQLDIPVSKEVFSSSEQIRINLTGLSKGNYVIRVFDQFDHNIYSDIKIIKIR